MGGAHGLTVPNLAPTRGARVARDGAWKPWLPIPGGAIHAPLKFMGRLVNCNVHPQAFCRCVARSSMRAHFGHEIKGLLVMLRRGEERRRVRVSALGKRELAQTPGQRFYFPSSLSTQASQS